MYAYLYPGTNTCLARAVLLKAAIDISITPVSRVEQRIEDNTLVTVRNRQLAFE